jgi:predicted DNA-binding protein YlxM (UPF0122 family)
MSAKHHSLTLKEKLEIVNVYNKEKLSVRDLSKRFNIGKTQAAEIVKKRTELLNKWHSNVNILAKRTFLNAKGLNIDKKCYDWFTKSRSKEIPLSGKIHRNNVKFFLIWISRAYNSS